MGAPTRAPGEGEHANTLRRAILDCPAWASFDLGPDKSWVEILPKQEDCFILRGLVPRHWTHHPPLPADQQTGLYVGTDASGGPEGKDGRWRVVAWAVVIAQAPEGLFPADESLEISGLEVVGTLKGAMQVGSTVAEGKAQALCEVARRTSGIVTACVDNKAAIAQAESELQLKCPQVWGDTVPPGRYQLEWIKSH